MKEKGTQVNNLFPEFIKTYGQKFGVKPEKLKSIFIKLPKKWHKSLNVFKRIKHTFKHTRPSDYK